MEEPAGTCRSAQLSIGLPMTAHSIGANMTLSDLASLGSFVSGVAVLVSLLIVLDAHSTLQSECRTLSAIRLNSDIEHVIAGS